MQKYLFIFLHRHLEFRCAEIVSLASLYRIPIELLETTRFQRGHTPFLFVNLPNDDDARKIASRAVLVSAVISCYATAFDYPSLMLKLKEENKLSFLNELTEKTKFRFVIQLFAKSASMAEQKEIMKKFEWINWVGDISLKQPDVSYYVLEDHGYAQYADGVDATDSQAYLFRNNDNDNNNDNNNNNSVDNNEIEKETDDDVDVRKFNANRFPIYFGKLIAEGNMHKNVIDLYSCKKRAYIGPTSMDPALSFIMANMAHADKNMVIFDPFVGTGSLPLVCGHFGSATIGGDIDWRILIGSRKDNKYPNGINAEANFRQKNLPAMTYPDMLHMDIAHAPFRSKVIFDSVVCDPPYGVRASKRTLSSTADLNMGSNNDNFSNNNNEDASVFPLNHVPRAKKYDLGEMLQHLLDSCNNWLVVKGRLVFWVPMKLPLLPHYKYEEIFGDDGSTILSVSEYWDAFQDVDNPKHENFILVAQSVQRLGRCFGRRLVTMEKIK